MRHNDLVKKTSDKAGVNEKDCDRVLNGLEDVLEEDLAFSKHVRNAVDKLYNLLGYFKREKRDENESYHRG